MSADLGARKRTTLAILNYNGRQLLDTVVPSVIEQDYRDRTLLVVDNGSSDGSADHVRDLWPEVSVIEIPSNVGVAAALNRAVAAVSTEYIALLNNDLELDPGWLGYLVETLDSHPGAASATGKLLNFHERSVLDGAGDLMRWSGAATHRGFGELDHGQFEQPGEIFAPCAGAALYRRAAFDSVGPFDEYFFAYQEDVDWGLRSQLGGFSSRYDPRAIAYHMGGATTSREPLRYSQLQRRNLLLVVLKNYPRSALIRHAPQILIGQLGLLIDSVHTGRWPLQLRAWVQVVLALPAILRKRREVKARRVASADLLETVMAAERYSNQTVRQRMGTLVRVLRNRSQ